MSNICQDMLEFSTFVRIYGLQLNLRNPTKPTKKRNISDITNRKKIPPMVILDFFECSENCDVASNLERYDQTLPHKVEVATVVVYI